MSSAMVLDVDFSSFGSFAVPSLTDADYRLPSRAGALSSRRPSRRGSAGSLISSSSPLVSSSSPRIPSSPPTGPDSFVHDHPRDQHTPTNATGGWSAASGVAAAGGGSLPNPRDFTPSLHANLVAEILALRREVDTKNALVLALEENVSAVSTEQTQLERKLSDRNKENKSLRHQMSILEGSTLAAIEEVSQDRDRIAEALADNKHRLDVSQKKVRAQQTDAQHAQDVTDREREYWQQERRQLDRKVHVAEGRLRSVLAEIEAAQLPSDADQLHRLDGTAVAADMGIPDRSSSRASGRHSAASRNRDSIQTSDGMDLSHSRLSNIYENDTPHATIGTSTLADELNLSEGGFEGEDSDAGYVSPMALPEEIFQPLRSHSTLSHRVSLKARRVLGLDVDDEEDEPIREPSPIPPERPASLYMETQTTLPPDYQDSSTQYTPPASPGLSNSARLGDSAELAMSPRLTRSPELPKSPVRASARSTDTANDSRIPSASQEDGGSAYATPRTASPLPTAMVSSSSQTADQPPSPPQTPVDGNTAPPPSFSNLSNPQVTNTFSDPQNSSNFNGLESRTTPLSANQPVSLASKAIQTSAASTQTIAEVHDLPALPSAPAHQRLLAANDVPVIAIRPPSSSSARLSVVMPPHTRSFGCQASVKPETRSTSVQTEEIRVDSRSVKVPPHLLPSALGPSARGSSATPGISARQSSRKPASSSSSPTATKKPSLPSPTATTKPTLPSPTATNKPSLPSPPPVLKRSPSLQTSTDSQSLPALKEPLPSPTGQTSPPPLRPKSPRRQLSVKGAPGPSPLALSSVAHSGVEHEPEQANEVNDSKEEQHTQHTLQQSEGDQDTTSQRQDDAAVSTQSEESAGVITQCDDNTRSKQKSPEKVQDSEQPAVDTVAKTTQPVDENDLKTEEGELSDDSFATREPLRKTLSKVKNSWKLVPPSPTKSAAEELEAMLAGHQDALVKGKKAAAKQLNLHLPEDRAIDLKTLDSPAKTLDSPIKTLDSPVKAPAPLKPRRKSSAKATALARRTRSPSEPSVRSATSHTSRPPFPVPDRSSSRNIPWSAADEPGSPTPHAMSVTGSNSIRRDRPPVKKTVRKTRSAIDTHAARTRPRSRSPPPSSAVSSTMAGSTRTDPPPLPQDEIRSPFSSTARDRGHVRAAPSTADSTSSEPTSVVDAIAQTMIGEWMWKYVRRRKSFGLPDSPAAEFESNKTGGTNPTNSVRHRRWVWVAPYERAVMWSTKQPISGTALMGKSGRKLMIQSVLDVRDDTAMPRGANASSCFGRSILILTPQRALKFTATSRERHYIWLTALSFLSHANAVPPELGDLRNASMGTGGIVRMPSDRRAVTTPAPTVRRHPIRDTMRMTKGRDRPMHSGAASQASSTQPTVPEEPRSVVGGQPADAPHVPRTATHEHKRGATGMRTARGTSSFRSLTNSTKPTLYSMTGRQHSDAGASCWPSTQSFGNGGQPVAMRTTSLGPRGPPSATTSASAQGTEWESGNGGHEGGNFFEALGTMRMEAFVRDLPGMGGSRSSRGFSLSPGSRSSPNKTGRAGQNPRGVSEGAAHTMSSVPWSTTSATSASTSAYSTSTAAARLGMTHSPAPLNGAHSLGSSPRAGGSHPRSTHAQGHVHGGHHSLQSHPGACNTVSPRPYGGSYSLSNAGSGSGSATGSTSTTTNGSSGTLGRRERGSYRTRTGQKKDMRYWGATNERGPAVTTGPASRDPFEGF